MLGFIRCVRTILALREGASGNVCLKDECQCEYMCLTSSRPVFLDLVFLDPVFLDPVF